MDDDILTGLVSEQLARLAGVRLGDDKPDLIIATSPTQDPGVPHLLIGGRSEDGHEALSLPLRAGVMMDRVRYMLSGRDRFAQGETITFLTYTLNSEDGMLSDIASARQVRLTDKEKLILMLLYAAPERSMDRKSLLQDVWGYAETAETHTLETHLYRLRQKLEDGLALKDLIVTKDGIYTLKV